MKINKETNSVILIHGKLVRESSNNKQHVATYMKYSTISNGRNLAREVGSIKLSNLSHTGNLAVTVVNLLDEITYGTWRFVVT